MDKCRAHTWEKFLQVPKSVSVVFHFLGDLSLESHSHANNVQAGVPELVDGLNRVCLGADCADLFVRSLASATVFLDLFTWSSTRSLSGWLACSSYDGCAAVVLGGLEGGIELSEPVDAASEGEVVKGGSSHCVCMWGGRMYGWC